MGIDVVCVFPSLIPCQNASQSVNPPPPQRPLSGTNNSKRRSPPEMHPGCETWSMKNMEKRQVQRALRVHEACMPSEEKKGKTSPAQNTEARFHLALLFRFVEFSCSHSTSLSLSSSGRSDTLSFRRSRQLRDATQRWHVSKPAFCGGKKDELLTSISANINAHLQLQQRGSHARAVVAVELALDVEHTPPQACIIQVLAGGRVEVPGARRGHLARRGGGRDDGVARALRLDA